PHSCGCCADARMNAVLRTGEHSKRSARPDMSTALVFAGNSFLGKPLCAALRQRGLRVIATTRQNPSPPSSVFCDLTHATEIESLIEREHPAVIIQSAGATQTHHPAAMYEL